MTNSGAVKPRQNKERVIMKANNLLLTVAVVAVAATVDFNAGGDAQAELAHQHKVTGKVASPLPNE
jgi:hypothetical protein